VLGEDQVVLRYYDGEFRIYGTPWQAHEGLCAPLGVLLDKLFFLERAVTTPLSSLSAGAGVAHLLRTAFVPYYRPDAVTAILDRLALLGEQVPFHTLACRLGSDVLAQIHCA
jgi:hypothetical protein